MALGPEVDPDEAARAAEIAFSYTRELAIQYQITDPPLIHNTKVNMGLKPRGLCWHWAEDMERRLKAEGFQTLREFEGEFRARRREMRRNRSGRGEGGRGEGGPGGEGDGRGRRRFLQRMR